MPRWPKKEGVVSADAAGSVATSAPVVTESVNVPQTAVAPAEKAIKPLEVAMALVEPLQRLIGRNGQDTRYVAAKNGLDKLIYWLKEIEGGAK
jgi:hypothetical protein